MGSQISEMHTMHSNISLIGDGGGGGGGGGGSGGGGGGGGLALLLELLLELELRLEPFFFFFLRLELLLDAAATSIREASDDRNRGVLACGSVRVMFWRSFDR